ncbi:MAG: hypothetical protein ACLS6W_08500 [Ruminococcus sp.]
MAKADETKRNPSSDLDDDIFAILNSTRPTYPGGGPNEQKPATQLNRRAVSQPNQPTQPQTNRPSQQTPVRPAAAPQQQPTPTQAVPPVSNHRCSAAGTAARSAATASAGDFSRCHGR